MTGAKVDGIVRQLNSKMKNTIAASCKIDLAKFQLSRITTIAAAVSSEGRLKISARECKPIEALLVGITESTKLKNY